MSQKQLRRPRNIAPKQPDDPGVEPVAFVSKQKIGGKLLKFAGLFALGTVTGGASWALFGQALVKTFFE